MSYGRELIIDVHDCTAAPFSRANITTFCDALCKALHMEKGDMYFWDYEGDSEGYKNAPLHLRGISAIQFISTSNITIHALDGLRHVYFNIFSCKSFDPSAVETLVKAWTLGVIVSFRNIVRE